MEGKIKASFIRFKTALTENEFNRTPVVLPDLDGFRLTLACLIS